MNPGLQEYKYYHIRMTKENKPLHWLPFYTHMVVLWQYLPTYEYRGGPNEMIIRRIARVTMAHPQF